MTIAPIEGDKVMNSSVHHEIESLAIDSLGVEILPGGCAEPVIHWGGAILVITELLRSSPAY